MSADNIVSLEGSGQLLNVLCRGGWEHGGHWHHQSLGVGGIAAAERGPGLEGRALWECGLCAWEADPGSRTASGSSPSDPSLLNSAQMEQARTEDLLCEGSLGGDSERGEDSVGVSSTLPGAVP